MVAFPRRTVSSSSMDVEPIKLFRDLKQAGFHSSVATTYSVDGAFYDGSVQRRLRRFDCVNNILIADVSMLSRALAATPETFALAGQRYAIVPARVRGCFHPKILLRLGARRARLLVGSANVTAAGWGVNLEIAACFEYRHRDKERAAAGQLVRKAYDYLLRWLEPVQGEAIAHKLRLHRRDSAWLAELDANGTPVLLPDGTAADLLCDFGDGEPGIMNRLVELVDGERVRQIVVVSPYWDDDLSALRNLRTAFEMPTTIIGLNPFVSEFPTEAVKKDRSLRFIAVPAEEGNERFLHAKIIIVSSDKADHVVFGSANCTDAALGSVGRGGTNAEPRCRFIGDCRTAPRCRCWASTSRGRSNRACSVLRRAIRSSGAPELSWPVRSRLRASWSGGGPRLKFLVRAQRCCPAATSARWSAAE